MLELTVEKDSESCKNIKKWFQKNEMIHPVCLTFFIWLSIFSYFAAKWSVVSSVSDYLTRCIYAVPPSLSLSASIEFGKVTAFNAIKCLQCVQTATVSAESEFQIDGADRTKQSRWHMTAYCFCSTSPWKFWEILSSLISLIWTDQLHTAC